MVATKEPIPSGGAGVGAKKKGGRCLPENYITKP